MKPNLVRPSTFASAARSRVARRLFLQRAVSISALSAAVLSNCGGSVPSSPARPTPEANILPTRGIEQDPSAVSVEVATAVPSVSIPPPKLSTAQTIAPLPPGKTTVASAERQPNVLLITVDTLRADRVGTYGFRSADTPTLDLLARQGARFERAICQMPQTNASHAALFTGLYPSTNGVKVHMVDKLRPGVQTMADVFLKGGYQTGGIYSWVSLDPQFCGLNQGFQSYNGFVLNRSLLFSNPDLEQLAAIYRQVKQQVPIVRTADAALNSSDGIARSLDGRADVTNAAVFDWLATHGDAGPFFLWVHYFDPHYPYNPPAGYDRVFGSHYTGKIDGSIDTINALEAGHLTLNDLDRARLEELYQGEIAYVDAQLARLFAELQRRSLYDNTVIVVTGDHGESFGEHGDWAHGLKVFESEIRVPLLMRYPSKIPSGVSITPPVQLIDVMPTLLDLVGLSAPEPVQGVSLMPMIDATSKQVPTLAFTELADESFVSILTQNWKLIRNNANGELQLYRLADDEGELRNLIRSESRVATELEGRLASVMRASGLSH